MTKSGIALSLILVINCFALNSQNYTRELSLTAQRLNGKDVVALQQKLLALGFIEIGEADGWFGPNTEKAVNKYLNFMGFNSTGKINSGTWKILFSEDIAIQNIHNLIKIANMINIKLLKKIEDDFMGYSTEGGVITRYHDNNETKYTELSICGEMGKVDYSVFHINNAHIVIERQFRYPEPFKIENAIVVTSGFYFNGAFSILIQEGIISKAILTQLDFEDELLK